MLTALELTAGIATIIPMMIGYTMAIITLVRYFQTKKGMMILSTIIFFALVSSWIGVSIFFISAAFGLNLPSDQVYIFSYAWAVPILATTWNFVTASLFTDKKYLKYIILVIFLVLDGLFIYFIYILNDYEVLTIPDLIYKDSSFGSAASIVVYIMAASVLLFIAPVYFWISTKTENTLIKFKSRMITIGSLLFAIVAVSDGILPLSNIILVIVVRTVLLAALIFLYLGYTTPKGITKRFEED